MGQRDGSDDTTPHDHRTLVLEVDVAAAPIIGHLTDGHGIDHIFNGWIGLLDVLDTALEPPATPGHG